MPCDQTQNQLHGYLDGELDALGAANFEKHLETCPDCKQSLSAEQSLHRSIQQAGLYERAPESLRRNLIGNLAARSEVKPFPAPRVSSWRWLAAAAVLLLTVLVGWQQLQRPRGLRGAQFMAASLVDAHLRSLQPGHLTDVESTDQHTVKPWFDGKLDFIPPVHDFMDEGFPLIGGRLDVLGERNVAALVYGRRKHLINVFVWPTNEPDTPIHPPGSRQGYQWVHWRHKGMEFCAVSDVSAPDLHELAQLIIQSESPSVSLLK